MKDEVINGIKHWSRKSLRDLQLRRCWQNCSGNVRSTTTLTWRYAAIAVIFSDQFFLAHQNSCHVLGNILSKRFTLYISIIYNNLICLTSPVNPLSL